MPAVGLRGFCMCVAVWLLCWNKGGAVLLGICAGPSRHEVEGYCTRRAAFAHSAACLLMLCCVTATAVVLAVTGQCRTGQPLACGGGMLCARDDCCSRARLARRRVVTC